jgi:hypothetical protein
MAPGKEGGRARRKGSAGESKRERTGCAVEKGTEQGRDVTVVDVDPSGAFFEKFWEQPAEAGADNDRHGGERNAGKGARRTGAKPGRQGRSPRAS